MELKKMWFLGLFLFSSVSCRALDDPTKLSTMGPEFRIGKGSELTYLFNQDSKPQSQLAQGSSETLKEFSKFAPPRLIDWNTNYTQKQYDLQNKIKKDKEYVQLLRSMDTTRKTEYFRRVLRSPLPESFKGDPKFNPETKAVLFSFD
jgi:hypothetical protein